MIDLYTAAICTNLCRAAPQAPNRGLTRPTVGLVLLLSLFGALSHAPHGPAANGESRFAAVEMRDAIPD